MAWLTYDKLEMRVHNRGSMSVETAFKYLEELGFTIEERDDGKVYIDAPDLSLLTVKNEGYWVLGLEGDMLTPKQVESMRNHVRSYFKRAADREEVNYVDAQGALIIPAGIDQKFLGNIGLIMSASSVKREGNHSSFTVMDREYPEFVIHYRFDPSTFRLTKDTIIDASNKLADVKSECIGELHRLRDTFVGIMDIRRARVDGKPVYECIDENDERVGLIDIPQIDIKKPEQGIAAFKGMLREMETVAHHLEYNGSLAPLAIETDAEKDKREFAARQKIEAARAAKDKAGRREQFQDLLSRFDAIGFDYTVGEKNGKKGILLTQRQDYLAPLRALGATLKTIDPNATHMAAFIKESTRNAYRDGSLDITDALEMNPFVTRNALDTGEMFQQMNMEDLQTPTSQSLGELYSFIQRREDAMDFGRVKGYFRTLRENDQTYVSIKGGPRLLLGETTSKIARHREIVILSNWQMLHQIQFTGFKDDLASIGFEVGRKDAHTLMISRGEYKQEVPCEGDVNMTVATEAMVMAMPAAIQQLVQRRAEEVLREFADLVTICSDKDGIHYTTVEQPDVEQLIPAYNPETHNLKEILAPLEALAKEKAASGPMAELKDRMQALREFGFSLKGNSLVSPFGIRQFNALASKIPEAPEDIQRLNLQAEKIVKQCQSRRDQQQQFLDKVRSHYGEQSVVMNGNIVVKIDGKPDLTLEYGTKYTPDDEPILNHLLTDDSFNALKKLAGPIREEATPNTQVDGSNTARVGAVSAPAPLRIGGGG